MVTEHSTETPDPKFDAGDNLRYVCDMLDQLKALAGDGGGPFLSYLIDMARMEAAGRIRTLDAPPGPSGKKRNPAA